MVDIINWRNGKHSHSDSVEMVDCAERILSNGVCNSSDHRGKLVPLPAAKTVAILKVLKERLPKSANVHAIVLFLSGHPGEFQIYTVNGDTSRSAWVVAIQEENGLHVSQTVSISAPENPTTTDGIKQAFIDTTAIDWNRSYMFNAIDNAITPMIMEISSTVKQNPTRCFPNYYYTISREDALNLEVSHTEDENLVIKRLDLDKGAVFITERWKYATTEDTIDYVKEKIRQHPSVGIYVRDRPVSAALTHSDLQVGLLTTDPDHRNKGYALMCMKTLLKNLAKEGYVPSSSVEQYNTVSMKFHVKCGMTLSHECDFIKYDGIKP